MNFVIPHLGQTSPSSFTSFTKMPPTDRHKLNGPSQAQRTVTSPISGNFSTFLAQKPLGSSLDRFPANKDKITLKSKQKVFRTHTKLKEKTILNTVKPRYINDTNYI